MGARAAPVCPDTPPAALESKPMAVNTASPQRSPPWRRKVISQWRRVSAQQQAAPAPVPQGLKQAAKLRTMDGETKVCIKKRETKCFDIYIYFPSLSCGAIMFGF